MMNYSDITSKISKEIDELSNNLISMQSINYGSTWNGTSYDYLANNLSDAYTNLSKQIEETNKFLEALDLLEQYKNNKEKISNYQELYNNIPDIENNNEKRNNLVSQISALENINKKLKEQINSILTSFTTFASKYEKVTFDLSEIDTNDLNYEYNLDELLSIYSGEGSGLKLMDTSDNLYNYYNQYDEDGNLIISGKDYIEGIISSIKETYSGREAAVNCALAILQLAADQGLRISYEHKGTNGYEPYVPTEDIVTGVDCNPFVSWVVDKGTADGFQWRPVGSFKYVGTEIERNNWSSAQPGDVIVNDGHVTVIIENNVEEEKFVIAHASGTTKGIILSSYSYNYFASENYEVRDMTEVYNGTENTNRSAFDQYVDWDTYERKI